jgi:hypothetical protein
MPELLSSRDVARLLGCRPPRNSGDFCAQIFFDKRVLVVVGRRAGPADYDPKIRTTVVEAGELQAASESAAK